MKTNKYLILLSIIISALLCKACSEDFLDIPSENQITYDNFWNLQSDAVDAVTSIYQPLQYPMFYNLAHVVLGDVWADDMICVDPNWAPDIDDGRPDATNLIINGNGNLPGAWRSYYTVVYRSNFLLENIGSIPEQEITDPQIIERSINEARFLRGLAYFNLVTVFGDVPLYTRIPGINEAKDVKPASKEKVWKQVEEDFRFAAGEDGTTPLPEKGKYELGRATLAAARGFLARAYLYQGKMTEAAEMAKKIISNTTYRLENDYGNNWNNLDEHGPESVFEVTFKAIVESGGPFTYGSTKGGFMQANFITPAFAPYGAAWPIYLPSSHMDSIYEINSVTGEEDHRAEINVFRDGDVYELKDDQPVFHANESSSGLLLAKYTRRMDPDNPQGQNLGYWNYDLNVPIIRLAEIYLIYAEAIFETDASEAWLYMNKIRERAGLENHPNTGSSDYNVFLEALMHERRIELFGEGHRFFDLRRWNKLDEYMVESYNGVEYMPVPEYDAALNSNLLE